MATLERKLVKRSKILTKAQRIMQKEVGNQMNVPVTLSRKNSELVSKVIKSVADGKLPNFTKKEAISFQYFSVFFYRAKRIKVMY